MHIESERKLSKKRHWLRTHSESIRFFGNRQTIDLQFQEESVEAFSKIFNKYGFEKKDEIPDLYRKNKNNT